MICKYMLPAAAAAAKLATAVLGLALPLFTIARLLCGKAKASHAGTSSFAANPLGEVSRRFLPCRVASHTDARILWSNAFYLFPS